MYRIMHAAPDISAVPPGLRPLVEAALAKDPQARPTAPQLLAELTNAQLTGAGARYENPTQTVLAQTWHPSATGPMGAAPGPTGPRLNGPGPKPSRRRTALLPVVLTLAFLLALAEMQGLRDTLTSFTEPAGQEGAALARPS